MAETFRLRNCYKFAQNRIHPSGFCCQLARATTQQISLEKNQSEQRLQEFQEVRGPVAPVQGRLEGSPLEVSTP